MTITIISTLRDRTPVPQEEPLEDAEVIWGGPSNFSWGSKSRNFNGDPLIRDGGGGVTWPDEQPEEDPSKPPIIYNWTETSRKEKVVRIDGPDGAYVDFARIEQITFRLPDSADGREVYVVQTFNNNQSAPAGTSTKPITKKVIIVPPTSGA